MGKVVKRRCGTCEFLAVPPDKDGKKRVRKNFGYPCVFDISDPTLPASVTDAQGWNWPPHRQYMTPERGENCVTWEARDDG